MEQVGLVFFVLSTWMIVSGDMNVYKWGRVVTDEYCVDETFQAQCSQNEVIVIQSAIYGHMALGRCVEFDTGHLGCQADVTSIVARKCNGKQNCQIVLFEDEEIKNTEPCRKGLWLFLQATHICVKALPSPSLCGDVQAQQAVQYLSSSQLRNLQCKKSSDHYDIELPIKAQSGQNIHLSIVNLNFLAPQSQGSSAELGYVLDGNSDTVIPITARDQLESSVGVSQSSAVSVYLSSQSQANFLIGFKASGCADLSIHQNARVERDGDTAIVVCNTSPQRWHLTCHGGHWMGVIGNCTKPIPKETEGKVEVTKEWDLHLPKGMVIMIIVCATVFLAVVVVTVGCVCLKWPKKEAQQQLKFGTIARKLDTSSDSQNTSTFKYVPESSRLLVADVEQPIWEQSLPRPPNNDQSTMRANTKRNNEEVYNMSLSSNSTDYERKKYFVLDKDYINANTITLNG